MILPDVNTLVYAFRRDTEHFEDYAGWLNATMAGSEPIFLPDVVLTGFLRVVTNRKIFSDPAPAPAALSFVETLRTSPVGRGLNPTDAAWRQLARFVATDPYLVGNLVPDAWIAALAVASGARVATADAGFARFEGLSWFSPGRER